MDTQTQTSFRKRAGFLAAAAVVALVAMCALLLPRAAFASDQVAHTVDPSTSQPVGFSSPNDAVDFGVEKGWPIYMDTDWDCCDLDIPEGKQLTIYMEGHTITNKTHSASLSIFYLHEDAELELKGDSSGKTHQITYNGYVSVNDKKEITTTTGGLLTSNKGSVPLIRAQENNKVILDGVTVGGAYSYDNKRTKNCGAINLGNDSYLSMRNGASVEHNASGQGSERGKGAGISANANVQIDMSNASVHDNYADNYGGGIYVENTGFVLNMSSDSKIENNQAGAGGGIYLNRSKFTIKSSDYKASISNNSATKSNRAGTKGEQSGGGIHVDSATGSNEGLIEGITIANNYSAYDGGGLELDQSNTTVRNCTITNNWCKYEGGGIYDCNSNNLIDGCTITGNSCNVDSGGNYEGGGVYVWCDYDLKLANQCAIKGNTRGKDTGEADDVFLRENTGATAKAYITGSLSKGSSVGVRSGITGDRRVATSFKPETKDCLFYDMDGYYISYGTDEGGDAWQRHRTVEYLAQLNGEGSNRYKWNSSVTLVAPLTKDGKAFTRWDTGRTTGLNPIDDYIDGSQIFDNVLSFNMPQNDVNAVATYADKSAMIAINVGEPEAGVLLPSTAQFTCGGLTGWASVAWYEVASSESGISVASDAPDEAAAVSGSSEGMTPVSGTAKAGTVYAASVTCLQSVEKGRFFSDSITADSVTVNSEDKAVEASVDDDTGTLTVLTENFEVGGDKSTVETGKANVKAVTYGLALSASESTPTVLGNVEVSYVKDLNNVTFTAPVQDGYNFCNWENVPEGCQQNDEIGTITVPQSVLDNGYVPTAVYTPVVTKVEFAANAPENGGDELASEVNSLWLTCSNGEKVDFAEVMKSKSFGVTWSPESEDGKADFSTAYTAVIELSDDVEGLVDVDKVVSTDVVAVAQNKQAQAAGFVVKDGKLCLAITFDKTHAVKALSVTAPEDVELTFEEAAAYQAEQESNPDDNCWPLGRIAVIALENGQAADGDITWEAVTGFDPNATTAQELTVKGTFEVAYCDEVDDSDISHEVTCKIKIAAPSQGGGDDGGDTPVVNPDDGSGEPVAGDVDDKQALAKTGDSIPVFAVAAVAAVALIAAGAASIAALRRRRS